MVRPERPHGQSPAMTETEKRGAGEALALEYCPNCGTEFESAELRIARASIRSLARLRDAQAEQIQMLSGPLVVVDTREPSHD